MAAIWAASSAAFSSSVCSARSSSGVRGRGEQGRGLGRERIAAGDRVLAIAGREALPLLAGRLAMPRQGNGESLDRRQQLLLQAHHEQSGCRSGARRARARTGSPGRRGTRRADATERAPGASSGSPSITTRHTSRFGNPPCTSRMSSLMRRTMTSSRALLPRTGTPRVKRYGSSSSSREAKLLEWPLWGVADRNRRCSKRPPRSRMARVNLVSMP